MHSPPGCRAGHGVALQVPAWPEQSPPHEAKAYPTAGVALSTKTAPRGTTAEHAGPQLMGPSDWIMPLAGGVATSLTVAEGGGMARAARATCR